MLLHLRLQLSQLPTSLLGTLLDVGPLPLQNVPWTDPEQPRNVEQSQKFRVF